jgi:hypothetical protein
MFKNHIYAENKEEALENTRQQYKNHIIGDVYLDEVWKNPKRWCIEVFGISEMAMANNGMNRSEKGRAA